MTQDIIPEDIQRFIYDKIDSIAQWEGLLLLRSNGEDAWPAKLIAERLYITDGMAHKLLSQLANKGFIVVIKDHSPYLYKYQPASSEIEDLVNRMAELYAQYLVPITHLIHSKTTTRIQEFADAFWLKKD